MTTPHARRRERAARRAAVLSSLAVCVVLAVAPGCGEDRGAEDLPAEPAYVIDIRPAPGGIICEGREVTVVFNRDPGDARCDEARLDPEVQTGSRRTFRADGGWRLSFAWDHGGALTVDYAAVICDYEEPILVAVTPEQGTLVTARELEASGIVLEFNAPVEAPNDQPNRAFRIAQVDGDAWDLAVSTAGRRVTLRVPAGVIEPGRSYVVTGAVTDERGNETEVALTYVTVAADE